MGPWFVRDSASPFRPGCSYQTLAALIGRGRVTTSTIIRGPTTRQFWMLARSIPGVAHLLGECHACHTKCNPADKLCVQCGARFEAPDDRQYLGLAEVRLLPGQASADAVAASALRSTPTGGRGEVRAKKLPPLEIEAGDPAEVSDSAGTSEEPAPRAAPNPPGTDRSEHQGRRLDGRYGAGWAEEEGHAPRGRSRAEQQRRQALTILVAAVLAVVVIIVLVVVLAASKALSGSAQSGTPAPGAAAAPANGNAPGAGGQPAARTSP